MKTDRLRPTFAALATLGATLLGLASTPAAAQGFPTKPVRIIVPFSPGSGLDQVVRPLVDRMSASLGQSVLLDYKPGGGAKIASTYVKDQPADGYTILVATNTVAANSAEPGSTFDVRRDLVAVGAISAATLVIAVNAEKIKATNVKELVEYARTRAPGELNYASYGTGTLSHLSMELLASEAGIKMTHVPFQGSSQATLETVAGRTDLTVGINATLKQHSTDGGSGKLRLIGVISGNREPKVSPHLPGMKEMGYPIVDFYTWGGFFAPRGTPSDVIARLNKAANDATKDPKIEELYARLGVWPMSGTPEQFGKIVAAEVVAYQKVFGTTSRDR